LLYLVQYLLLLFDYGLDALKRTASMLALLAKVPEDLWRVRLEL
jgi:hypothetical protein